MPRAALQINASATAAQTGGTKDIILWAEQLNKSHDGDRVLFDDLTFTVSRGDRVAVVGANGSGKSTLLKLLAGKDSPNAGNVQIRKGINLSYMSQEADIPEDLTVMEAVLASDSPAARAVRAYEQAVAEGDTSKLTSAINQIEANDAWGLQREAHRIMESLDCDVRARVGALSGGQRRRTALAAALLSSPDVLVLDEPTNHMDVKTIQWMEENLAKPDLTLLLVSHDRRFMESLCTRMLELEGGSGYVHSFGGSGSYRQMLQMRAERFTEQMNNANNAKNKLRKESEWMSRMPKARSTKSRARIDQFYQLQEVAANKPKEDQKAEFGTSMTRLGSKVMVLTEVAAETDPERGPIFSDLTYEFPPGDRVGIVGANGSGKSTLLNLLVGRLPLAAGVKDLGETIKFGFLEQEPPEVPEDLKMIDYIRKFVDTSIAEGGDDAWGNLKPETILERVGFSRPRQQQPCLNLSGGERRRLHLAQVLLERPNFLILDEPTNDLDLQTIEVLEDFITAYTGCLVVVSHDRAFMDNTVDHLFVLKGDGKVRGFDGNYTEYLEMMEEEEKTKAETARAQALKEKEAAAAPKLAAPPVRNQAKKLNWRETQEYEGLEAEIESLQKRHDDIGVLLEKGGDGDYNQMMKWTEELATLTDEIDEKSERWLELAERME